MALDDPEKTQEGTPEGSVEGYVKEGFDTARGKEGDIDFGNSKDKSESSEDQNKSEKIETKTTVFDLSTIETSSKGSHIHIETVLPNNEIFVEDFDVPGEEALRGTTRIDSDGNRISNGPGHKILENLLKHLNALEHGIKQPTEADKDAIGKAREIIYEALKTIENIIGDKMFTDETNKITETIKI